MSKRPAEYLLRFDDLCPAMDSGRWLRFEALIRRFAIQPILAIVPENCDQELERKAPDAEFWERMRTLQADGAAIGLHGYRHLCEASGRSLVPLHSRTEFAGVAPELQREWIRAGLRILHEEGLEPRVWVAPRHGSDAATLTALQAEGIALVSDGFASRPFREAGLIWIPQQLWRPVEKRSGMWTICLHANSATDETVTELESFLERCSGQFTSVDRVLAEWKIAGRSVADRWFHARTVWRMRLSRLRKRFAAE